MASSNRNVLERQHSKELPTVRLVPWCLLPMTEVLFASSSGDIISPRSLFALGFGAGGIGWSFFQGGFMSLFGVTHIPAALGVAVLFRVSTTGVGVLKQQCSGQTTFEGIVNSASCVLVCAASDKGPFYFFFWGHNQPTLSICCGIRSWRNQVEFLP
ncbi:hypothetical protein CDAR_105491 [Caerostris darwini]|uniref:Uncharacterized protein n=1 Tax=Caerostris darwini TaxID=1538125 RepID=A0AAV4MXF5_9ARAC|nr:hypothetical protein CDAR_105491 [Caerostris darwini]